MLDTMNPRGTRGAYRKEDRVQLPAELQKELVEKAAAKFGNCQELAKRLNIPKSSVHYYRIGRLTMPVSVLEQMLKIAGDDELRERIESRGITKDRSWATEHAQDVFREMCRDKVRLPTRDDLDEDYELRRKAAAIVSYVLAEGSVWLQKEGFGEYAANVTFADHETDLYEHFRSLCRDVFRYELGSPQRPGNNAKAIRGFIYSRFVAEWLMVNGVPPGDKAQNATHLPSWVMLSDDPGTLVCALQPWCDGEGSVRAGGTNGSRGFSLGQSCHTDLDFDILPRDLAWRENKRVIGKQALKEGSIFGVPAHQYCAALFKSVVFCDVKELFERLGFHPTMRISSMYLKDNGFWSCNWSIEIDRREAERLVPMRLVQQARKRAALTS